MRLLISSTMRLLQHLGSCVTTLESLPGPVAGSLALWLDG